MFTLVWQKISGVFFNKWKDNGNISILTWSCHSINILPFLKASLNTKSSVETGLKHKYTYLKSVEQKQTKKLIMDGLREKQIRKTH